MNATDRNQIHRTLTRCASELRGIAARLRDDESDTAEAIDGAAAEVLAMWSQLRDDARGAPAPDAKSFANVGLRKSTEVITA
jgi:hypothetical protein